MTDQQRLAKLRKARRHLENTVQGHTQWVKGGKKGDQWKQAIDALDELAADLRTKPKPKPKVPQLGKLWADGKSVLMEDCTHITSNLGWPAFDTAFGRIGEAILAPEDLVISDDTSSAQGGDAFYAMGESEIEYWFAHIVAVPKLGTKFKKGQKMTTVSGDHPRPHLHVALNTRRLIGKHLTSHNNYTHGAPLIGKQLEAALK